MIGFTNRIEAGWMCQPFSNLTFMSASAQTDLLTISNLISIREAGAIGTQPDSNPMERIISTFTRT